VEHLRFWIQGFPAWIRGAKPGSGWDIAQATGRPRRSECAAINSMFGFMVWWTYQPIVNLGTLFVFINSEHRAKH
jgi:hypothetical protein